MNCYLLANELWGTVNGTETVPGVEASENEVADYNKRKRRAWLYLPQLLIVTLCIYCLKEMSFQIQEQFGLHCLHISITPVLTA